MRQHLNPVAFGMLYVRNASVSSFTRPLYRRTFGTPRRCPPKSNITDLDPVV